MGLVPVQLNERVEDFTVDKSLLFQRFQRASEVVDHAPISPLLFVVVCCTIVVAAHAAAEEVVGYPEDRLQEAEAPEVLLIDLLEREHRVLAVATANVQFVEVEIVPTR